MTTNGAPRLLVDIQTVQGGFFGNRGIRRYVLGLTRALLDRAVVRAVLVNPGRPWLEEFPPELRDVEEMSWTTRRRLRELDDGATAYVMSSPFERTSPVDAALPSYVVESGMPIVAVLYDLIPEIVDVYPPSLMSEYRARRQLVKEVDLVLTLSEHVRRDALDRLGVAPERVSVIGAAAADFFRPARPGEQPEHLLAARTPRITRPFVLSVTGWLVHKNVERLVEAWSRLTPGIRRSHQLVLTCPLPPGGEEAWNSLAAGFGLGPDDVVVTGRVDDDVVRALYQRAELAVLPSFEEGFGLPVLEAARCACPVITSSTSSLPEVLAWEPSTFPPHDVDAMADTIERGLLDPLFRADLHAAGDLAARRHTWGRVGDKTVHACNSAPSPRRSRQGARLRLAVVGTLTPSPTPATNAIDRIAAVPHRLCDVHRFDTGEVARMSASAEVSDDSAGTGAHPGRALGQVRDPWGYDAIVYLVDRHPTVELRELARAYPGVVWFLEAPEDRLVVNELTQNSSLIVRSHDVPAMAIEPGPFDRAMPSTIAPRHGPPRAEALLETLGLPVRPVRQPTR